MAFRIISSCTLITNILQFIILTAILIATVNCRRHLPLLDDDGTRRNRPVVSECQFGKSLYELGSTWYADLGPPFGVMYCIKCECKAVPKKRRIVARVQCHNMKNDCPPTNCDDPILLPGKCCKTCPGDNHDTETAQDVPIQVTNDEEERNMKHFAALLTGRTSQFLKREEMKSMYSTNNPQNIVATGRFTFHKKNLYYSFYVSSQTARPRTIQFIDDVGSIIEEHILQTPNNGPLSLYQNSTGKICGVWRRVPRDYKRLLREEKISVALLWGGKYQAELALGGQIAKYTALSTELFSSLLEPPSDTMPDQMSGAGGTAIVSTSSGATSSIHLTLVFNGLFNPDDIQDIPINIRIDSPERKQTILDEVQRIKKPATDINIIELSSPVSTHDLRLLSRGKLVLTIESRKNPLLKIQGPIITRVVCELFQTLLTPHNFESQTQTSGLAWMYLNRDGSLVYNIQTDELNLQENPILTLIDDSAKRKTELEDLTPYLNYNQAIGTIDRLGPRVLEPLYSEDLSVNIATEKEQSLVRGRLLWRPVADARDSVEPILLKRVDTNSPAHLMGMAWVAIDNECNLHYEVTVNGFFSHQQAFQIYLEEKPIEAPGAPVTRKLLDEFVGPYMEGFALDMLSSELAKLETSVCYLEIFSKDRAELLLRAKLKSTKVPGHCFPVYTDNDVPSVIMAGDHNDNHLMQPDTKCYHSGRFYDEGEQWKSTMVQCTMCACQHGRVNCDTIKCPTMKCEIGEELKIRKGECCPLCFNQNSTLDINNSTERSCRLGDQYFLAGASWHPYLPPNGFDTCTTCTCDPHTLDIHCPRVACPPLLCIEKVAYRPDKKACCKICPEGKSQSNGNNEKAGPNNPNMLRDQGAKISIIKSTEEILANGGCKAVNTVYENGQEWHPVLATHGEQKCIKCRCKDSHVSCDRKRCTRSVCNSRIAAKRRGLAQQQDGANNNNNNNNNNNGNNLDECCSTSQCRRSRRHQNHHRRHRDRDGTLKTHSTTTVKTTNSNRS